MEKIAYEIQILSQGQGNEDKIKILQDVVENLSNPEVKNDVVGAFDTWRSNDEFIAHPLLVLHAAQDIDSSDVENIKNHIRETASNSPHIEEYIASKTLDVFSRNEWMDILKLIVGLIGIKDKISPEIIRKLRSDVNDYSQLPWLNEKQRKMIGQLPPEVHKDLFITLQSRMFIKQDGSSNDYLWNPIVYNEFVRYFDLTDYIYNSTIIHTDDDENEDLPIEEFNAHINIVKWVQNAKSNQPDRDGLIVKKQDFIDPLLQDISKIEGVIVRFNLDQNLSSSSLNHFSRLIRDQTISILSFFQCIYRQLRNDENLHHIQQYNTTPISEILDSLFEIIIRYVSSFRKINIGNSSSSKDEQIQHDLDYWNMIKFFDEYLILLNDKGIVSNDVRFKSYCEILSEFVDYLDSDTLERTQTHRENIHERVLKILLRVAEDIEPQNIAGPKELPLDPVTLSIVSDWTLLFERIHGKSNHVDLLYKIKPMHFGLLWDICYNQRTT